MAANIVVPQLGESIVEARVARWLKQAGDAVKAGEPLVELETDKIDVEVSAERAGVLAEIRRNAGDDVQVGEVLGLVDESGAAPSPPEPAAAASPPESGPEPSPPESAEPAEPASKAASPEPDAPVRPSSASAPAPRSTPTARNVARAHDVPLGSVEAPADGSRISRRDVERFLAAPRATAAATPASPSAGEEREAEVPARARREERVRMSKRRQTIARNLVEAQRTAAMLSTFNEIDMSAVMALRRRRKDAFQKQHGVSLGLSSFFVKAAVGALKVFPNLNAEIRDDEIVLKHYYDIGIAVGASQGLVVPVLRDADELSFAEIERRVRDVASRAESGDLTLADLRGGTFTITNGGVFGSLLSTPILNPPQVGILGLHKIADRPVAADGQVVIRPVMYVALTYDHRIVDGREAVQFLVRVKELIEDPGQMLLDG